MEDRLKPCPFCGGEAEMRAIKPHKHYFVDMADYGGGVFIECTECTCAMSAETEEEAIEAWNTREPIDRIVERLERRAYETADWMCGGTMKAVKLTDAIEIVKNGGKNE